MRQIQLVLSTQEQQWLARTDTTQLSFVTHEEAGEQVLDEFRGDHRVFVHRGGVWIDLIDHAFVVDGAKHVKVEIQQQFVEFSLVER